MKIKKKTGFRCAIEDKHGKRCARECQSCKVWRKTIDGRTRR